MQNDLEIVERILDNYEAKMFKTFDQFRISSIHLNFSEQDVETWNKMYEICKEAQLPKLTRTSSGSISKKPLQNLIGYDVVTTNIACRLTIISYPRAIAFTCSKDVSKDKDGRDMHPARAWRIFVKELDKDGIDLDDYKISKEAGMLIKQEIKSPLIFLRNYGEVLENVNHIDFHNSYPAGLCNTHPEFRPTIERLYNLRHVDPIYKEILNYSIGCMQSPKGVWKCRWAHLAKDAINDNYDRVSHLCDVLYENNRDVIGCNTDGIWYVGDVFHGEGEGPNLGEWHNDHINCTFRAKSDGAYEYIENGIYTPVIRGRTLLDRDKKREDWNWGDIYQQGSEILKFKFDEETGIHVCIS